MIRLKILLGLIAIVCFMAAGAFVVNMKSIEYWDKSYQEELTKARLNSLEKRVADLELSR